MCRSLVAPLSGDAQCDIVIAIYRISLSFAGNELGNDPTARKQLRWRRRLDLICTSGQRRTNTLVARTYARWPFRAGGVLDPLARTGPPSKKSRRASGPAGQRSMSRPVFTDCCGFCQRRLFIIVTLLQPHLFTQRNLLLGSESDNTNLAISSTKPDGTLYFISNDAILPWRSAWLRLLGAVHRPNGHLVSSVD